MRGLGPGRHHGAHAQQGQGEEPILAAVQAIARVLAQDLHAGGAALLGTLLATKSLRGGRNRRNSENDL